MEGSVATRKVRAKRFVECFMESFRIVDFLSPVAPGWIYDGRRTRKRTSILPLLLGAAPRKYKRILFKFFESPIFCAARDTTTTRERGGRLLLESGIARPSREAKSAGRIFATILFRIIDVKNIFRSVDQCGRARGTYVREGTAVRRAGSRTPSCYWISIGKRLFLPSDRGCHFGSFVTETEHSASLFVALSRAESARARKGRTFSPPLRCLLPFF